MLHLQDNSYCLEISVLTHDVLISCNWNPCHEFFVKFVLNNAPLISFSEKLLFAFNFAEFVCSVVISDLAATKFDLTVLKLSLNHGLLLSCPATNVASMLVSSIVLAIIYILLLFILYVMR